MEVTQFIAVQQFSSCSCYKFITEEEIDLQLNQEDEREVVAGQFYILISSTLLQRRRGLIEW